VLLQLIATRDGNALYELLKGAERERKPSLLLQSLEVGHIGHGTRPLGVEALELHGVNFLRIATAGVECLPLRELGCVALGA
jgi:hypothetical protein